MIIIATEQTNLQQVEFILPEVLKIIDGLDFETGMSIIASTLASVLIDCSPNKSISGAEDVIDHFAKSLKHTMRAEGFK